jgi:proteasome lid subunit RPN8/RPN11
MKMNNLLEALGTHSIAEYPRECCGIITTDFEYIPCKNVSTSPKNSFVIDPFKMLEYEDNIWGFFHSHPGSSDPFPSKNDLVSSVFKHYKFIVGFSNAFYIYWLENDKVVFERLNEHHLKI